MILAAGIDLGGTKIETQVFGPDWALVARRRRPTPQVYDDLVAVLVEEVAWAEVQGAPGLPIGIAAAGLVNPSTGLVLAANLCATGRPLPTDVNLRVGRTVPYINDCRALTLSETVFGAGRGLSTAAGLILGTGLGGGLVVDGRLVAGRTATGGEIGHIASPAHIVASHGLPIVACGCGRMGCIETLVSGLGLVRLAAWAGLPGTTPEALVAERRQSPAADRAWAVWCELAADLLVTLTLVADPEAIILGGGLSRIEGMADDLSEAFARAQIPGFPVPRLILAEGGAASGARGAALAAHQLAIGGTQDA